jgi:transcriptional regulator with PAS, ATPase and Fis domain
VSPRKNRKLVKVDCTAIPENLLESELFGHKKGSFTGADRDRMGRILQADGGTIFLDEIGDISSMMQLRLLRFLQERTFYPVGQDTPIQVDVRVVAATNADLKKKVEEGTFREDLYFRLRVIDIKLPPLRERKGDISTLARHFVKKFSKKLGKDITGISDQALECLDQHKWPGNVRELEHVIERACVLCQDSTLSLKNLPREILPEALKEERSMVKASESLEVPVSVNDISSLPDPDRIVAALKLAGGNKAKAARILGVDRTTVYRKLKEYNIDTSFLEI